ncbi:EutN/CcmL family microcompartment protein [bacterium]|nr:EutN/CcmL family microcompartment protein [candidate division CSSED10-310 bacterium]
MLLAEVVGTVVSTQKEPRINGRKLLVIQPLDIHFKPSGTQLVAVDSVGAGQGEVVLYASGSSARQTELTQNTPCDAVIMAIVDQVEFKGDIVFDKARPAETGTA